MKTKRFFSGIALFVAAFVFIASPSYAQAQKKAKYVFFFIGDGMGFSHVALTEAYLATEKHEIGSEPLCFTQFPVMGMSTTYSASNMITCSSAAATAMATGIKTRNNMLGVAPDSTDMRQVTYDMHDAGFSVGIMTTVTIDHATPGGFYGHSADRNDYYSIAMQLPKSGFEFFGGGGFDGANSKKIKNAEKNIFDECAKDGYTVAYGVDDYKAKKADAKKMILFQADPSRKNKILPYVIGRTPKDLTLKQVITEAIDFLYKPEGKGFFIMCEGGKIDWAAHSNDMAGVVMETLDMDEAVKVAFAFYKQHPDETLIVVTADHETGGVTLGRTKGYTFDLSGIDKVVKEAAQSNVTVDDYMEQQPLDSLSKAARIGWTTRSHTGGAVPVFAVGAGSRMFSGRQNNTDLPKKICKAMGVKAKYTQHYYSRVAHFAKEKPVSSEDIVFIGNSLIEGGKWNEYFPAANQALAKKGGAIRNRGIIGDTADGINDRLDEILKGKPRKIFLMTGPNDVSHDLSADSIVVLITNLVKRIKAESPKTSIYLHSVLPINESFKRYSRLNGKTAEFSAINAGLAKMAKREHITFMNIYPLFLEGGKASLSKPAAEQVLNPELTCDGLHVTADGYKIWVEAIKKYVK